MNGGWDDYRGVIRERRLVATWLSSPTTRAASEVGGTVQSTDSWGWAGTVREFLSTPRDAWLSSLADHLLRLLDLHASQSQQAAWRDEHTCLFESLQQCVGVDTDALDWGMACEYELPLEGGRRPDVVVLAGRSVIVLEFKSAGLVRAGDLDQVRAYARDLADYHEQTHGLVVQPILVLAGAKAWADRLDDGTIVTSADSLARYLHEFAGEGAIDLDRWLSSPYQPLPTLVAAAKRIFRHEPLPHVFTALSAGIPQALEYLLGLCRSGEADGGRTLAFVTGVPGSGKTLVGLRLVYEGSTLEGKATFLSGNGPLVEVLRYALKSTVFVKDLHKVILDYGKKGRVPREHIIVFDEAQRAWDREHVSRERGIDASEPDLLIGAATRVERWAVLVGLVGEGQEIYAGEEAGMDQWQSAISHRDSPAWDVHCPTKLRAVFAGQRVHTNDDLDLTVSLRSRRASTLHDWVDHLLANDLAGAARLAARVQAEGFPLYLTRDLDEARAYTRWRYEDEPATKYGIIASSHARNLERHGVENGWMATKRVRFGPWYDAPKDHPQSCCALDSVVTEFGCQGLELDLPIVAWGADHRWDGGSWLLTPVRRKKPIDEPERLLRNAYRVLLTRGRDGLVVFVPDDRAMDGTEVALLAAGIRPLPEPIELPALRTAGGAA